VSEQVERNKETFKRFQAEVIVKGDTTHLADYMAPGFITHRTGLDGWYEALGEPARTEPIVIDDLVKFGHMLKGAFGSVENHQRRMDLVSGEGDLVWAVWTITGTINGSFHGVAADGKSIDFTEVAWIRFNDDGKMIEGWFCSDVGPLLAQLGASVSLPG